MPNIFSTIVSFFPLTYRNVDHHTFTEQKMPDNRQIHRLPQNCGPSVWNLLHSEFPDDTIYAAICVCEYSGTPLIRTNWDRELSGCAENPESWIFL